MFLFSISAVQAALWFAVGSQIQGSIDMFFRVCKAGKTQPGILTSFLLSHYEISIDILQRPLVRVSQGFLNVLLSQESLE